ncbi:MAG: reverse transcriptase domain-containing protein [Patescibacteria group bacterium]
MFAKIISAANLKLAYLNIVEQFAADEKAASYHGLDNLFLRDFDLSSSDLISIVRAELIEKKEIDPAISVKIPKKNNPEKFREIFIYNLKERVKAQAIFQIVLPVFESNFSDRLFSYRPGKPPYLAAKNFCRRYRHSFANDHTLILDLENYSDLIDKNLLFSQLQKIFSDPDVLAVLRLFVFNRVYCDGKIRTFAQGLIQGVPLIAMFANLYLSDLDFKYQNLVPFYIRVGDDIAITDQRPEKLVKIKEQYISDILGKKLKINERKVYLGPANGSFSFLGYHFHGGVISLEAGYLRRIELNWKGILAYREISDFQKDRLLKKIMAEPKNNYNFQFEKIIRDKPQINDSEQIIKFSELFFRIMTKFFYHRYSPQRRRLLESRLKGFGVKSVYSFYKKFHYERD